MELCSLDDAFNSLNQNNSANTGCTDNRASTESRRQERKKARKCRGPVMTYHDSEFSMTNNGLPPSDPDRPSMNKMEPIPTLNSKTGLREHAPVEQDWGTTEPFVGESSATEDELKAILQRVQGQNTTVKAPSYFGASPTDVAGSPLPKKKKEGFTGAPYSDVIGSNQSYMLNSDFTKNGQQFMAQKSGAYGLLSPELQGLESPKLPPPERALNWRNGDTPGGMSLFYDSLKNLSSSQQSQQEASPSPLSGQQSQELLRKMDAILARLDDKDYVNPESAQREVLLFIMTGLGVLFLMDVTCRVATR
jgi:hypothetical protein